MGIPPATKDKFLKQFDSLLHESDGLAAKARDLWARLHRGGYPATERYEYDAAHAGWALRCRSLLAMVLPSEHPHHSMLESFGDCSDLESILRDRGELAAVQRDFSDGFLDDLVLMIESEIAADYLGQAERLITQGQPGKFDHVPAAVLAGAVLEKALRTLCDRQSPPIPTHKGNGEKLTLNPLIDGLKKARAFNELTAKQLRAWADIRNKAAHGEFDQFGGGDVERMVAGISDFLAKHL